MDNNFIINNLAAAVNFVLTSNLSISQALLEDISFLAKLTTPALISYVTKKQDAMERLNKTQGKGSKINHLAKSAKLDKIDKKDKDKKDEKNEIGGNEYVEEDTDEIKFILTDETAQFPRVKSATISKLIERLTHEVYPGNLNFQIIFRNF